MSMATATPAAANASRINGSDSATCRDGSPERRRGSLEDRATRDANANPKQGQYAAREAMAKKGRTPRAERRGEPPKKGRAPRAETRGIISKKANTFMRRATRVVARLGARAEPEFVRGLAARVSEVRAPRRLGRVLGSGPQLDDDRLLGDELDQRRLVRDEEERRAVFGSQRSELRGDGARRGFVQPRERLVEDHDALPLRELQRERPARRPRISPNVRGNLRAARLVTFGSRAASDARRAMPPESSWGIFRASRAQSRPTASTCLWGGGGH